MLNRWRMKSQGIELMLQERYTGGIGRQKWLNMSLQRLQDRKLSNVKY